MRGDKVGLIGPNGAGKTTLLKMILGELAPDAARCALGTNIAGRVFRPDARAARSRQDPRRHHQPGQRMGRSERRASKHVMSYLGDFLFAPERARSPVRSLSGGERNRLLLARLFARPANVLVLDEPTNDLDIETLELLEELLADYDGTVLLVSHDRAVPRQRRDVGVRVGRRRQVARVRRRLHRLADPARTFGENGSGCRP